MGLFCAPKKEKLIAVFDVTSSSVGGILFLHHPSKLPEVLSAVRFPTDFLPDLEFQKIQRALHKTFERTVSYLKKRAPFKQKKPDLAAIVFSSPYYVSQANIICRKKPKPFEITKELLKEIINEETSAFKKQWEQGRAPEKAVEIMEEEAMGFKINGYPVSNPIGKRGYHFELSLYLGLGIKIIQDKLRECVSHSFGDMPLRFQSFPFSAYRALKDIIDISKGLLLVDIGGEITDLILIRNNILEETVSFPLGENFLIRRIASAFHFSPEESFALLSQYTREGLHTETREKVKKILEEAGQKWCEFFDKALSASSDFSFLPQNRLVLAGKAALALKDLIVCVKEPLTVQFLFPEAFQKHFVFRKGFSEDKDIWLMISSLYVDKLLLTG